MGALGLDIKREARSSVSAKPLSAFAARPWAAGLLLLIATFALYYPVHDHPFIHYDDSDYVTENPQVQWGIRPATVVWAFTTYTACNWHPLTWLSHALDYQLFGLDPAGHHDVNVLLHAVNAVLLFWVLLRATGYAGRSFMVAALFALHPLNVESVAWVAERKNVLSMLFFLLALGAYRWYTQRPRVWRYAVVSALFALGLMAKPQIITLPFVLLLWDYWPLERLSFRSPLLALRQNELSDISGEHRTAKTDERPLLWLVLEKLPFLLIAAANALITLRAQQNSRNWFPRSARVGNAVLSYALYLKKAFWPTKLALLYPHPGTSLSWARVGLAGLLLAAITVLVLLGHKRRYLPVGWFWFLGTLVPMLGIVQVGVQAMADRYAYLPFIGVFLMICWGAADWAQPRSLPRLMLPAASALCLLSLAIVARQQIDHWQSDIAIWTHTLQVTENNWVAESQLGGALAVSGQVAEGVRHYNNALAMNPDDTNSNMGIAVFDIRQNDYRDAIRRMELVTRDKTLSPTLLTQVYNRMAKCYQALGETARAQEYLARAKAAGSL